VGVGESTLPLERRSVLGDGEGLSCCEGPASVSSSDELPVEACVATEEPPLLLRHVQHLLLKPPWCFWRLYLPHSHHGAFGSALMGVRLLYLSAFKTFPVRVIESLVETDVE